MSPSQQRIKMALMATMFIVALSFNIVFPILPHFARNLGATAVQVGLLAGGYALGQLISAPFWGRLSDRRGRKPVLLTGLAGLFVSYLIPALAPNYTWLLIARIVGGLFTGATLPTSHAIGADLTGPQDRARIMGELGAARGVGWVLGPIVGAALVPLGLTAPFYGGAAFTLLVFAWAGWVLPEPSERTAVSSQESGPVSWRRAMRGLSGIAFFLGALVMFAQWTIMTLIGLYLTDRYGGTAVHAGIVFGIQGVAQIVVQTYVLGRVVAWLGEARTLLAALITGTAGYFALSLAPNLAFAMVSTGVCMTALGLARPTILSMATQYSGFKHGMAMGILTTFESAGRIVGPLTAGALYDYAVQGPYLLSAFLYLTALLVTGRALLGVPVSKDKGDAPSRHSSHAQGHPSTTG